MGRLGSFATMPKAGSDYTSQIEALRQQQENATWQAIQDAWNNGGTIADASGKQVPVTDAYVLAYMRGRRDEIGDSTDPLWQQWNNNVTQLAFSIDESKIGLRFKQGKVSAAAVADFYKKTLASLPVDSEFYRTVAAKAADWANSVRSAAESAARSKAIAALQGRLNTAKTTQAAFKVIEADFTAAAVAAGYIKDGQHLGDIADPADFWQKVDYGQIRSPFTGAILNSQDWTNAVRTDGAAFDEEIAVRTQAGQPDEVAAAQAAKGKWLTDSVFPTRSIDAKTAADLATEKYQAAMDAAQGFPDAQAKARTAYKTDMLKVIDSAKTEAMPDIAAIGSMEATVSALDGDATAKAPTWGQFQGMSQPDTAADIVADGQDMVFNKGLLDTATGIYTQVDPTSGAIKAGGVMRVIPTPTGASGKFDPTGTGLAPTQVDVGGGVKVDAWIPGQAIHASFLTLNDGSNAIVNGTPADMQSGIASGKYKVQDGGIIGFLYQNSDGTKRYGVVDANGKVVAYTQDDPFAGQDVGVADSNGQFGYIRYIPPATPPGAPSGVLIPPSAAAQNVSKKVVVTDPNQVGDNTTFADTKLTFGQRTDLLSLAPDQQKAAFTAGNEEQARLHGVTPAPAVEAQNASFAAGNEAQAALHKTLPGSLAINKLGTALGNIASIATAMTKPESLTPPAIKLPNLAAEAPGMPTLAQPGLPSNAQKGTGTQTWRPV